MEQALSAVNMSNNLGPPTIDEGGPCYEPWASIPEVVPLTSSSEESQSSAEWWGPDPGRGKIRTLSTKRTIHPRTVGTSQSLAAALLSALGTQDCACSLHPELPLQFPL